MESGESTDPRRGAPSEAQADPRAQADHQAQADPKAQPDQRGRQSDPRAARKADPGRTRRGRAYVAALGVSAVVLFAALVIGTGSRDFGQWTAIATARASVPEGGACPPADFVAWLSVTLAAELAVAWSLVGFFQGERDVTKPGMRRAARVIAVVLVALCAGSLAMWCVPGTSELGATLFSTVALTMPFQLPVSITALCVGALLALTS